MNKIITAGCMAVATFAAVAVPTKTELEKARLVVENTTKADLAAYRAGEKTAQKVAAAHIAYAQKAEGEAAKYLLLQGAFKLYARSGEYDLAAEAIVAMKRDIKDLPPAVIAEIVGDELRYVSDDKAPRLVAMLKEAKRTLAQEEDTRKASKVDYQAKTIKQVRRDVAHLFPGWSLDTEVQHLNIESADSGLHASHRGQNNVICLHPVGEGKSTILSRSVTLSKKNPCLFLTVASYAEKVGTTPCDFLLSVRINGKDALSKRRICTPDSAPWEYVTVPLFAWRGQNVKIEVILTANGWWYEFPYLSRLEVGEGNGGAKSAVDGHLSFCYSENRGRREIVAVGGQRFLTQWSGCGADSIYTYRDYVELIGVSDTLRDFPTSSADFVSLDWEQRAPTIKKGAFVVFLNAANEFLCVRVDDVKSKSRGDKEDKLSLTYRAYEADVASSKSIHEAHRIAQSAYSIVGNDQGSGEFRYAANGGRLLIQGSQGQQFDTMWSSCSADSVYAYNDYVGHVSTSPNRTSFPATAGEFQSLDWSRRSVTVSKGASVVFRNKSYQYLCVRISDVKSKSRGDSDDLIRFDFKIYSALGAAGEQRNRYRTDLPMNVVADKLQACDFLINKDFKKNAKYYLCLFSASWCGPCRAEMSRIASTYAETLKTDPNIELIHFSRDQDDEKALAWAKEHAVKFPVVKPKGGNPLNLHCRGIPHLFIMKADGTLVEEGHPAGLFNEERLRSLTGESGQKTVNGYTWSYVIDNDEVMIVSPTGKLYESAVSPKPKGRVVIPASIDGKPVTRLGKFALCKSPDLISVKIPTTVTSIGDWAFSDCDKLTSLTLPAAVARVGDCVFSGCPQLMKIGVDIRNSHYKTIDGILYTKDMKRLVTCAGGVETVSVPAGVVEIGDEAFRCCRKLKSITIPSRVRRVGENAFCATALESVVIPSSVNDLDNAAFWCCGRLTSVTLSEGVSSIGGRAFYQNRKLKSIRIPASVKKLGYGAFEDCRDLCQVTICGERPESSNNVFNDCPRLKEIHVPANAKSWAGMKEWQGKPLVFDAKAENAK